MASYREEPTDIEVIHNDTHNCMNIRCRICNCTSGSILKICHSYSCKYNKKEVLRIVFSEEQKLKHRLLTNIPKFCDISIDKLYYESFEKDEIERQIHKFTQNIESVNSSSQIKIGEYFYMGKSIDHTCSSYHPTGTLTLSGSVDGHHWITLYSYCDS